ncbi:MAG: hypothetical protein ACXAD7_05475 [Candidatus Kariarchaeaceae archaeon]
MKVQSIFLLRLVIVIGLITLLLNPMEAGGTNNSTITLNQVEIIQPDLFITSIDLNSDGLPEDGELIELDITIENEDDIDYAGLELTLMIEEDVNLQHGPAPEVTILNKSLSMISSTSTIVESMSFVGHFGQYTLTAGLMANGTILPDSVYSVVIQVISQPIGKVSTLILIILIVLLALMILIVLPAVVDKFKS